MNQTVVSVSRFHPEYPFVPRRPLRSDYAQALLTQTLHLDAERLRASERPILLDAGEDKTGFDPSQPVKLLGYYNRVPDHRTRRGLVLSLHGWEGCSHSAYNISIGTRLLDNGYDLFRLNLRDHGPGYHVDPYRLNRGIFFGTLIDEAATAVRRVAEMAGDLPFYIIGPSMGGNFALRLALRHGENPFPNLHHVVAISPAINPGSATRALDANPLYLTYFRKRWIRSLKAKQARFPDLYDFSGISLNLPMYELTDILVRRFGQFPSADAYFSTYGVKAADFEQLHVATTIITASDDGVIPVAEFYTLPAHPLLRVQIHPAGGHVGFTDLFPVRHHLPELVLNAIRSRQ